MNNPSQTKVDKILRELHGYEVPLTGEVTLDADLDFQNKLITREINEAKQALYQLFLDCVKDEAVPTSANGMAVTIIRNQRTAEIRSKLKEIFGEL